MSFENNSITKFTIINRNLRLAMGHQTKNMFIMDRSYMGCLDGLSLTELERSGEGSNFRYLDNLVVLLVRGLSI